jgi:hypothetical protein
MVCESPVDRHQLQPLDLALGEQKAIERIERIRLGLSCGCDVGDIDLQEIQANFL